MLQLRSTLGGCALHGCYCIEYEDYGAVLIDLKMCHMGYICRSSQGEKCLLQRGCEQHGLGESLIFNFNWPPKTCPDPFWLVIP
jgi:hypothetical protein